MYVGLDSSVAGGMGICCSNLPYTDFTTINTDFKGRFIYAHVDNSFNWHADGSTTNSMQLLTTGLSATGTVTSSGKRLKYYEKPIVNAISVINRLVPVEYDQTVDLIEQYTEDTPQFHQCGFIAQKVQQIEELKHVVIGGEIGEDGKETVRCLNYNIVFTYAVKAIEELSDIVKQQQEQIDAQERQIDRLINIILNACFLLCVESLEVLQILRIR